MHPGTPRRPRRVVLRALALGIGSLFAAGLLVTSPAAVSGWNQASAETTLWQLLNGARANNGRAPLQQNGTLVSLARWRSSDMLAKSYFSHTIVGCGCLVYAYYDSNGLSYDWAGENIGWNSGLSDSASPVRVHEAFMESPGHRANVLDPSFTHGGVGAAAADNQSFLGHVQSTRMYTELFMEATSGGGGGAWIRRRWLRRWRWRFGRRWIWRRWLRRRFRWGSGSRAADPRAGAGRPARLDGSPTSPGLD